MAWKPSKRTLSNLDVHKDLVRVTLRALEISSIDFVITDGGRTRREQEHYVKIGASKTMNSRHLGGFAVDFAPLVRGKITWAWPAMTQVANAFKQAGKELGVPIEWGGDWKTFKDGPHIQLSAKVYK